MPAGLIEEYNSWCTWGKFGCDFVEMDLHGFAIAGRQHEGDAGSSNTPWNMPRGDVKRLFKCRTALSYAFNEY